MRIVLTAALISTATLRAALPENYQLQRDWLLDASAFKAAAAQEKGVITLSNGLVTRQFRVEESGTYATIGLRSEMTGEALLRSIRPDADLTIDGTLFSIGGTQPQPNHAFLRPDWLTLPPTQNALVFTGTAITRELSPLLEWKRVRHAAPDAVWPPKGCGVRLDFSPKGGEGFRVAVHHELYDGIPAYAKWITISNTSDRAITLDRYTLERLAVPEADNPVETRIGAPPHQAPTALHVETEDMFGGCHHTDSSTRHTVRWLTDPLYKTQVNYDLAMPCLLEVSPDRGPAITLAPGSAYTTPRAFILIHDATDRQRRTLAQLRLYRTLIPWATENPLFFHCVSSDPAVVRAAIDQAAETGFEMVIISFGSGFNADDASPAAIARWKPLADHAKSKGIDLGCYSLLSSRRIGGGNDIVTPPGIRPTHGSCPALTSPWGLAYHQNIRTLLAQTGMTAFEQDGPYPGDIDITPRPPLQKGIDDSRRVQWEIARDLYRWCRARGIYITAPEYCFHTGSNKTTMGYREVNWSLPRAFQLLHTRQNIFDGTRRMLPSMGWMFVPLTQYHGGGPAATIEPLDQNLAHYEAMMFSNLSAGVQAAYRGTRLYDTPRTRDRVKQTIDWFKTHRTILESDVIHLRRPDGLDWDGLLHIDPAAKTDSAIAILFNPLQEPITREITLPLYYANLTGTAALIDENGNETRLPLDALSRARITLTIPANRWRWLRFKK